MGETLMLLTEKELYYNKMMAFLEKSEYEPEGVIYTYEALLAVLKVEDKKLEDMGFTECHFSRYELVKLIEKAQKILNEEND